jgi:NifU-like protein
MIGFTSTFVNRLVRNYSYWKKVLATEDTERTEKENYRSLLLVPSVCSVSSVAKKTGVGVSFYPEEINEYFLRPRGVGEVFEADATGATGSHVCGAALRLTLKLDAASHQITEAKFKATGCGYLIAAASVLTEVLQELTLADATALPTMLESVITEQLGEFPIEKEHCAKLCRDALGAALTAYRTSSQTEWTGDEALICTCFGVSERRIEEAIEAASLHTIAEVTRACNAGGGCGSCQPLIEDILDDYWRMRN